MKDTVLYKYSGAGNDFIVLDGRYDGVSHYRNAAAISSLCDRHSGFAAEDGRTGADGLMILSTSATCDFRMEFFNPDGSTGMMCGNGGRCITAFAEGLGIVPGNGAEYVFEAPDGIHRASVVSKDGDKYIVRLRMRQPSVPVRYEQGWFIDTGARHVVRFVDGLESLDVAAEGSAIRHDKAFAPDGVNVDFVSVDVCGGRWSGGTRPPSALLGGSEEHLDQLPPSATLAIRTFEKGVEAETLACGTGIVAAALIFNHLYPESTPRIISVHARKDTLEVEIYQQEVWLTGPAELICSRL